MATGIQKDFLEIGGFAYNEGTFDNLFLKGWSGFTPQKFNDQQSTCSSDEEEEKKSVSQAAESVVPKSSWGEELDSVISS